MNQLSPPTKSFVIQWYWMVSFMRRTIIQILIPSLLVKIYNKKIPSRPLGNNWFIIKIIQKKKNCPSFPPSTIFHPPFYLPYYYYYYFKENNKLLLKINNNEQRNFDLLKINNNEQRNFLGIFTIGKHLFLSKCLCT